MRTVDPGRERRCQQHPGHRRDGVAALNILPGGEDGADEAPGLPRVNGRPRGAHVDDRILDAAILEYAERGQGGFSMSGVARRAQVGKSALYLRWPDKQTLLGDAVLARTGWAEEVDQGSVRADLERLLFRLMRFWLEPSGWALLRIAVDGVRSGNRPTYQEAVTAAHRRAAFALVDRAVARGELRTGTPAQLLADVVYGTSMMKALTTEVDLRSATDAALLQTLSPFVDFLMSGLEPYVAPDPVGGPERLPASRSAGD